MAYLDPAFGHPAARSDFASFPPRLGRQERIVLMLSRADRMASLRDPGRLSRWLGIAHATRLADPRLEALRRFAVLLRHRGEALAARETERLCDAGFTTREVRQARAFVLRGRHPRRPIRLRALIVAILLAPACWSCQRLADWTNDPLIGLVLTFVGLSALAPLATTPPIRQSRRGAG